MKPLIRTYTGKWVNPLDLKPEDISFEDISHHLCHINRFNGAVSVPINVGLHSYWVAKLVWNATEDPQQAIQGILHDATEAYLGDMTKWLKHSPEMKPFRDAEDRAHKLIMESYELPVELFDSVKSADKFMVMHEGRYGFQDPEWPHIPEYRDIPDAISHQLRHWVPANPQHSKYLMLSFFMDLVERITGSATLSEHQRNVWLR